MLRKVALHNLGCKVNAYELDAMEEILVSEGYEIVPFAPGADIYIINTCTVTNVADRKSRQMLHKAKKMNPDAIVVAVGCYVQTDEEGTRKDEAVDLVVGNNRKKQIGQILREYEESRTAADSLININQTHEFENLRIHKTAEHTRAYIKVQDGCNQFCSYCIIPYARGRVRSRRMDDVLYEIEGLAKAGYREVVLTGIHLSSYGIDFPEEEKCDLLDLITAVHQIEDICRIRLGSLEPRIITEEFAGKIARLPKVCPHFHLSLQSGCDETLKRMNRRYDSREYEEKCRILRQVYNRPALTTDVIVGFPQETGEEFEQSYRFVERIKFYETHIFKYSMRHGTRAAAMDGQIPEQVKAQRSSRMIELGAQHAREYEDSFLGEAVEVLLEETYNSDDREYYVGHTREYMKVAIPMEAAMKSGDILSCKVTGHLERGIVLADTIEKR